MYFKFKRCYTIIIVTIFTLIASDKIGYAFVECKTTTEPKLILQALSSQCTDEFGQNGTCESSCNYLGGVNDRPINCILHNKQKGQCCIRGNHQILECSTRLGAPGTCKATCGQSNNVSKTTCLWPSGQVGNCCPKDSVIFPNLLASNITVMPWSKRVSTIISSTVGIKTTHQIPMSDTFWKKRKFFKVDQIGCGLEAKINFRKKRQLPDRVSYIVGGSNVIRGTHPWFVAVGKIEYSGNINWDCGGSVINDRWVLTSAHCLYGVDKNRVRLLVGGENLKVAGALQNIRIFRFVIHPDYLGSQRDIRNDIALIEVLDPLETTPICLQPHGHQVWPEVGSASLVLGYGYDRSGGHISDTLKEAKVTIVAKSECIKSYGKLIQNSHDLFCARGKIIEGKQINAHSGAVFDSCQGDSGGPMVRFYRENFRNVYNIVGVIAGGKGCGHQEYPGIYIDLKHHIDWIIDTVVS